MSPTADDAILTKVDEAVAESRRRAGAWIACQAGCAECCYAAFPITALDAERLRRGLALLHPARAAAIVERARGYVESVRESFPGDWATGRLDASEEWRDWFFARQKGRAACPALDESRGECELYEHRPVACRLYGHLIQIGDAEPGLCRLCFVGAAAAEREACHVRLPESAVNDQGLEPGHTIVAFALTGYPGGRACS